MKSTHHPSTPAITVAEIAERLGATLHGSGAGVIRSVRPLEIAGPEDLSFLAQGRRSGELFEIAKRARVGALLTTEHYSELEMPQLVTPNPLAAVIKLSPLFYRPPVPPPGVHSSAVVHESAVLGENVSVGPYAVIGEGVTIGADTIVHPHVVIYAGAEIGPNCILHAGAVVREFVRIGADCVLQSGVVVGGDGFGYVPVPGVTHQRIPHIGTVVLEDSVDLGANATIDRATLGETRIGKSTKIDNLVMVGHNVTIGERSLLCSQVGVSGSCRIGNDVVLAGQVGVADHCDIADRVRAAGKAGIVGSIPSAMDVSGSPHAPVGQWRRASALTLRLPELFRRLRSIEKKVGIDARDE